MKKSEKQTIQSPVGWFLTGKVNTIERAFDELASLEARIRESELSSYREKRALIDVLTEYKLGLPTNTLAHCKADIWYSDSLVCNALMILHRIDDFDILQVDRLDRCLGHALESLLKVYGIEETRIRAYTRMGEAQPHKSKRPKPSNLETEKAPNEA